MSFKVSLKNQIPQKNKQQLNLFEHPKSLGHCVIAGAAKCGSSSLYKYLCQHPNILAGPHKEINYITRLKGRRPTLIDYSKYLGSIQSRSFMTIDGSAQYFRSPGKVPQILYDLVPKSRIILLLRDPVEKLYSHYWMSYAQSAEFRKRYSTFEMYIQKSNWKRDNRNRYAENLERWYSVFPKEQIFVANSTDFFRNPQRIVTEIFGFLGLENHKIQDLRPIIPFARKGSRPGKYYPPIAPETAENLREYFEPLNRELYSLLGRDLGW